MTSILTPLYITKSNCCNSSVDRDMKRIALHMCESCGKECEVHIDDGEMEEYELAPAKKTFFGFIIKRS